MSDAPVRDPLQELKALAAKSNVDISKELLELERKLRAGPVPQRRMAGRRTGAGRE